MEQEQLQQPVDDVAGAKPAPTVAGRRRFLRYLLGFSIVSTMALIIMPVIGFLVPPKTGSAGGGGKVSAGMVDDIPLGQAKVVPMGSKPTIVVNTEQGVTAFSAICTHLGCIVAFDSGNGTIVCPCHDGRYNPTTGAVISGPPPGPLAPVTVTVEDGEIFLVDA
jgi:cytochrome b6-f complex iron-sulfur subunit